MSYMGGIYLKALRRGYNTVELARAYGVPEHEVCAEIERARRIEQAETAVRPTVRNQGRLAYAGKYKGRG